MTLIRRLLTLVAAVIGSFLYVWYTAVRATPGIKRRKAARRAVRRISS